MKPARTKILFVLILALFAGGCRTVDRVPVNSGNSDNKSAKVNTPAKGGPALIKGTVVHISDGDTFIIETDAGERITIRIHAIDAPELAQTFGRESREELRALIANQTVEVRRQKTDQFRRTVGTVFLDGKDIGLEMIGGGYAWHFKQYQKEQPADERKFYADAETAARDSRLGLWRDENPLPPRDYRRSPASGK